MNEVSLADLKTALFIGGAWVAPIDGGTIDVIDPATERCIHRCPRGTADDIDRAVQAARAALPGWGATTCAERSRILGAMARGITERLDRLARIEVLDNGKPLPEARWDVEDAAGCFAFYADLALQIDAWQDRPIELPMKGFTCKTQVMPVGVCGLIIPWNYPLLMAAWKVAPALAAGCTVVLKPSEFTPLSALELGAIAQEAGLPPGVLNVVPGLGADAGAALAAHRDVAKITFTGSVPTGSRIMQAAAADIKAVSLELGGKSPIVVFDDADLEAAVEWILFGIFWNQGEVCSATSRLLVQDGIADHLLARLAEEARRIIIGPGLAPGVLLGPLVSRLQHDKVLGFVERAKEVATLLCGGGRPAQHPKGFFVEPTIFVDVPLDAELWTEEIFGPVLAVRRFGTEAEAIAMANGSSMGLAAAVMGRDLVRCERVAAAFEAGIVWINCSQPTFVEAPWGGVKRSGIGRELGEWGLRNYLETKQITTYDASRPWGWYLGADD